MERTIRLIRDGFPTEPGLDTAVSRAMLMGASEATLPESFRIHVPGRIVAFGKRDTLQTGYRAAVEATRAAGFLPIERLAGGRAAVFHEGTLAFNWAIPDEDPRMAIRERFAALSSLMVAAFARLGIDAAIGEVPGEYCPGAWSVHSAAGHKLMGVGQRLARRATHVGGVVVVRDAAAVNRVLSPVYEALDVRWRPEVTGALEDAQPGVTVDDAADAIVAELGSRVRLLDARVDDATLTQARSLAAEHVAAA